MYNPAQPIIPAATTDIARFCTKYTLGRARNNGDVQISRFPSEAAPLPGGLDGITNLVVGLPMTRYTSLNGEPLNLVQRVHKVRIKSALKPEHLIDTVQ